MEVQALIEPIEPQNSQPRSHSREPWCHSREASNGGASSLRLVEGNRRKRQQQRGEEATKGGGIARAYLCSPPPRRPRPASPWVSRAHRGPPTACRAGCPAVEAGRRTGPAAHQERHAHRPGHRAGRAARRGPRRAGGGRSSRGGERATGEGDLPIRRARPPRPYGWPVRSSRSARHEQI
jgi:hypothetical protein